MIVSTNTLLNILLPNDNKTLKNVLKEADTKQLTSSLKSGDSVQNIIKNLFNETINHTKSNETILNLLKNSSVFKEMGNFTTELKTLQSMVKNEPSLSKFENVIKDFLINIKNLDENTLKEQLGKSGVFLESKLNNTLKTNNLPNKIENILLQLKQELSKLNTPQSKDITNFIDKLLTSKNHTAQSLPKDLNTLLTNIKNITELKSSPQIQNLVNLTTQLKSLSNEIELTKPNIQNTQSSNVNRNNSISSSNIEQKSNPLVQIKELLTNIKDLLSNVNLPKAQQLSQEINNILTQKNIPTQDLLNKIKDLSPKIQDFIINQPTNSTMKSIEQLITSLKILTYNTEVQNTKTPINPNISNEIKLSQTSSINNLLQNIKQNLSTTDSLKTSQLTQSINNILNQGSKPEQIRDLIPKLETFILSQPSTSKTSDLSQLTKSLNKIINEPSPTQINQNTQNSINVKLNELLTNIKSELLNSNLPLTKDALEVINKLLLKPNINQINELLTKIKTIITNTPNQTNIQPAEIYRLINQLENSIKPNSALLNEKAFQLNPQMQKEDITKDIKSTLLKIAEEVKQSNNPAFNEAFKQVDKLLTQVDYYQLMSLTSSSNFVYFPFIWDMLEDGSLSMKKLNEEKFYCEINLKLKEYGKINLLLVMYEKNHLDISIFAQKKTLKDEVSQNLQALKRALSGAGIIPGNIKLLDLKEENETKDELTYTNNHNDIQDLDFGVNIKV